MAKDRWLPVGFATRAGRVVGGALMEGQDWRIRGTDTGGRVLVAGEGLGRRWVASGLLGREAIDEVRLGDRQVFLVAAPAGFLLQPVARGGGVISPVEAMAFARALRAARRALPEVPLHDGIYVESHGCILPLWTVTERIPDEVVLGRWLTGGVHVPVTAWRRLRQLVPWISPEELRRVAREAGLGGAAGVEGESAGETAIATAGPFRLPGRRELERFFNEHVVDVLRDEGRFRALGVTFPGSVVLHGPPGSGKTWAVERLVEFLGWPLFSIESSSVGSPYIHETGRMIARTFSEAADAAPSCVVIDEMEAFLPSREDAGAQGHRVEEVSEFLRQVAQAGQRRVLVLGTTNMLQRIDRAVLRRGRFDHVIEVGMPDRSEVLEVLEDLLSRVATDPGLELEDAASALAGRPLSDVAFVVREAGRIAGQAGRERIDQESLAAALRNLPRGGRQRRIGFIDPGEGTGRS